MCLQFLDVSTGENVPSFGELQEKFVTFGPGVQNLMTKLSDLLLPAYLIAFSVKTLVTSATTEDLQEVLIVCEVGDVHVSRYDSFNVETRVYVKPVE